MREVFVFRPPRRNGNIFHGYTLLILSLIGAYGLWQATLAVSGLAFLLYLLGALAAMAFIPILLYRLYALQRARYVLARDGISLRWGLRVEEIPIDQVSWVGSAEQYGKALTRPFLHTPGAVIGVQSLPDGKAVEFMAGRDTDLVIIETTRRTYAISPANRTEFLQTYRRLSEFGSLKPIEPASDYPTFLLSRSWADRPARILLISSTVLALGLLVWVSLTIPNHPEVSLRPGIDGSPTELVPGMRLLLLPVLNTFFFAADLLLGLFFYRKQETRVLGYLMWASSSFTSLLFTAAVFSILSSL